MVSIYIWMKVTLESVISLFEYHIDMVILLGGFDTISESCAVLIWQQALVTALFVQHTDRCIVLGVCDRERRVLVGVGKIAKEDRQKSLYIKCLLGLFRAMHIGLIPYEDYNRCCWCQIINKGSYIAP